MSNPVYELAVRAKLATVRAFIEFDRADYLAKIFRERGISKGHGNRASEKEREALAMAKFLDMAAEAEDTERRLDIDAMELAAEKVSLLLDGSERMIQWERAMEMLGHLPHTEGRIVGDEQ